MSEDRAADLVLDGNAVGGLLQELYGSDVTAEVGTCPSCGHDAHVGAMLAYTHGPGMVLRCPSCTDVLIRVARTPRGTFVEVRALGIAPPPAQR